MKTKGKAGSSGYPWAARGDASPTPKTLAPLEKAAIDAFGALLEAVPADRRGPGTKIDNALALYGAAFFGAKREVAGMEFLRAGTREVLESMTDETLLHMLRAMESMPGVFAPGGAYRRKAPSGFKI